MKWITRRNIKVDRVACPWLIRRFIDPNADDHEMLKHGMVIYDALFSWCRSVQEELHREPALASQEVRRG